MKFSESRVLKNKDFTLDIYRKLLIEFLDSGYTFLTLEKYSLAKELPKLFVILRHDVDRKPRRAYCMAKIENELEIEASYYFRIRKESNKPEIINNIIKLNHEIGYHYENLSQIAAKTKFWFEIQNIEEEIIFNSALNDFKKNLEYFRLYYDVKTICMHGSPLSKWDNRALWNKFDYKNYGIIAEPYFDIDFNDIFYITDASRSWNNRDVTFRDFINSKINLNINSIYDMFLLLRGKKMPFKLMINVHPEKWTDSAFEWYKIYMLQNLKNIIKKGVINFRNGKTNKYKQFK